MADFRIFLGGNSDALVQLGAGLLSGRTASEQLGNGLAGFATARKDQTTKNSTLKWLQENSPDLAGLMQTGAVSPGDAVKLAWQQRLEAQKPKHADFQTLPDGTYGSWDGQTFTPLGSARKPIAQGPAQFKMVGPDEAPQYGLPAGHYQINTTTNEIKPFKLDDPNAPVPLTALDKKAIMEADDQAQSSQAAIDNLGSAENKNNDAYSGFTAGVRTWMGNNLPDVAVPDFVASPKYAAATTEYDNQVMNGALNQLKSIFGGNPTEGERAVLLELQASSDKPPEVRKNILDRAKKLASIRLQYNQQRAQELRGGDYYKPQANGSPRAAPAGQTGAGVPWRVK